ncbi:hypothetical protein QNJ24_00060 [Macrococcus caseolyticus]|uniref:hypothetical protein n=1 Tax=Macrococcoides caseolyticum TaxID=69966 RepID=UPI0024BC3D3E|nr:hypothetical protein [Macrococcus caseolyticus]MDJ1154474.1 hypothetical protein [Macrococcus caseolyticus]
MLDNSIQLLILAELQQAVRKFDNREVSINDLPSINVIEFNHYNDEYENNANYIWIHTDRDDYDTARKKVEKMLRVIRGEEFIKDGEFR